ncbi:Disease resistance RPP13 protein 4 isoform X1 [Spatholobus suberectus]|nr:Disease resistance RPP13 protein 4 isoform X1 [Spatholobus suberectus]
MDGICKRIRERAHKLLPMDAFESSEDDKSSQILHSSYPSSTQHNNYFLLPCDENLLQQDNLALDMRLHPLKRCLLKTAEEVGGDVIDELLKSNLIVPYESGIV